MITFGAPGYFALAVVVAAMLVTLVYLARWRLQARAAFAGPQSRRWPASGFLPRTLLLLAAAGLIVFAAARPQWGDVEQVREVEGIDLVIVLDISQSMTAADADPSRLGVAQRNLTTLVEAQRGSRFGLVLFAGSSIARSPLTSDTQAMSQLILRANRENRLVLPGSDLGDALERAGSLLQSSETTGRAVLLVSDGEDFAGRYDAAAQSLEAQGIVVYTAGVGTETGAGLFDTLGDGSVVPKVDAAGQPVVTRLQEDSLRAIAEAGRGRYVYLSGGGTGLFGLRNDLARLEQTPLGAETLRVPIERFQIFAAAAIVLLLASWFLPGRLPLPSLPRPRSLRPRPGLALVLLALLVGACGSDSLRDRNQEANALFEAGDYQAALGTYQALIAERPDVDQFAYNAGNTLHRLEAYDRAVTETQRALPPTETQLGAITYYALGNHLLALNRLEEAYVAYRNALLLDPDDRDAKHNLEVVLARLEQRDNPPPDDSADSPPETPGSQGSPEGSPTPEGTGEPGAPGGTPTPAPGADATPTGDEPPISGTPGGDEPTAEEIAALQRALEEALAGIDEELTYEDAIQILDLLRQQQEQRVPAPSGSAGPDY